MRIFSIISAMFCFLFVNGRSISVKGPEGGEVSFRCSHRVAQNNFKYFCKDPCKSEEHVLAKVIPGGITSSGRVTLWDHKDGSFTVTMSHLQTSDKGKYWCAVDRVFDTFTAVYLNVTEGLSHKTTTNIQVSTITEVTSTLEYKIINDSTLLTDSGTTSSQGRKTEETTTTTTHKYSRFVLYLILVVLAVFTVTVAVALCFRKCRQKTRPQEKVCSSPQHHISFDLNQVSTRTPEPAVQPIYANIGYSKATGDTESSTISRHDHFPSYVEPLPALPEKDRAQMCGANTAETCARGQQASLWFGLRYQQT